MRIESDGDVGIGGAVVPHHHQYASATLHLRQETSNYGSLIRMTSTHSGHTATDGSYIALWTDNNMYYRTFEGSKHSFWIASAEKFAVNSSGIDVTGSVTADSLTVDDITINGSTISDGGDLTVDVGAIFNIDADTQIILKDDGTSYGTFYQSSSDFYIQSLTQDKDIVFYGNDGGSGVNALTLDMSDAGSAIFNNHVYISDNSKLQLGASSDLQLYHDGSNSYITEAGTGVLTLQTNGTEVQINNGTSEYMARFITDGAVTLYHNGAAKIATTATGISINGDNYISMQENHFINRRFEMDAADNASPVYILLCLNAANNDVNGTITMDRTSGFRHACSWNMIVTSGTSTTPLGSLMGHSVSGSGQPSARLVTLTYSSVSYVALELTNPEAYHETTGAYFNGRIVNSGSNTLTPKFASAVTSVSALAQGNSKAVIGNTLSVGDITINGSTISDAADLTIDVAGDIILDADSGEVWLKDGGTNFGRFFQSSGNLYINHPNQDQDIIIQGNDGGSNVNALTFDMSDAGAASFNNKAVINHNNNNYDDGLILRSTLDWGYGTSLSFDAVTSNGGSNGTVGKIQSRWQSAGNHALDFYVFGSSSLTQKARLDATGLAITGTLTATGDITAYYSDERLKDFEGKIDGALDKVSQLSGYYFRENDKAKELGYDNDALQVGVSAQEVEAVMPEVVKPAPVDPEYKTVQYEKLIPLLIEAIKELKEEVRQLKEDKA